MGLRGSVYAAQIEYVGEGDDSFGSTVARRVLIPHPVLSARVPIGSLPSTLPVVFEVPLRVDQVIAGQSFGRTIVPLEGIAEMRLYVPALSGFAAVGLGANVALAFEQGQDEPDGYITPVIRWFRLGVHPGGAPLEIDLGIVSYIGQRAVPLDASSADMELWDSHFELAASWWF